MPDMEMPNRKSNMEKAEGERPSERERGDAGVADRPKAASDPSWESGPREQEPLLERHPYRTDPTKNDTAYVAREQSTIGNADLGSRSEDPVMPSDDETVRTKI
jgi:hypothetical protein